MQCRVHTAKTKFASCILKSSRQKLICMHQNAVNNANIGMLYTDFQNFATKQKYKETQVSDFFCFPLIFREALVFALYETPKCCP